MIKIDTQVHGYQQGHQLLASSVQLPKNDQSVIDRLSDVAGPLRPAEVFDPYLSAYPLPSGVYYVLARTWQDTTVARAGCVRTLSLLIPIGSWSSAESIFPFLQLLDSKELPISAPQIEVRDPGLIPIPPAPEFQASELLEALFLEGTKPVAIFDVPKPEIVAMRLLCALWRPMRNRFSLSTFALSPRRIEGHDFDLVFVPKDARSRFSDWSGRRIDGRTPQEARHRWTGEIVNRVFKHPFPRLLSSRELNIVGVQDADTAAALRIALRWDELIQKLEHSPSVALGLIDIANSRKSLDDEILLTLRPALGNAIAQSAARLPSAEAWDFISAVTRKIYGTPLQSEMHLVVDASANLATRYPKDAIDFLEDSQTHEAIEFLVPGIAKGLGVHFNETTERALLEASDATLVRLLLEGDELARLALRSGALLARLSEVFAKLESAQLKIVTDAVLPLLTKDYQFIAARPLLAALDSTGVAMEVERLGKTDGFSNTLFIAPLVNRAREINAIDLLRSSLLSFPSSNNRNYFLWTTLAATHADVKWLLDVSGIPADTANYLLFELIRSADAGHVQALFNHDDASRKIINRLPEKADDLLWQIATTFNLTPNNLIAITLRLLPKSVGEQRLKLANKALECCLGNRFNGDEITILITLLEAVGSELNAANLVKVALGNRYSSDIISRNLIAFERVHPNLRVLFLESIDDISEALSSRWTISLEVHAVEACARLIWDASNINPYSVSKASGRLLPVLMRSRNETVSFLIAATFPFVYRELAKQDDVPELYKFVPFFDWDRCKAARHELVDAFIFSRAWAAGDLALTAYLSSDIDRILRRVMKQGGNGYIERIVTDLPRLPEACRELTMKVISQLRADRFPS